MGAFFASLPALRSLFFESDGFWQHVCCRCHENLGRINQSEEKRNHSHSQRKAVDRIDSNVIEMQMH